jgi:hypothetical protein
MPVLFLFGFLTLVLIFTPFAFSGDITWHSGESEEGNQFLGLYTGNRNRLHSGRLRRPGIASCPAVLVDLVQGGKQGCDAQCMSLLLLLLLLLSASSLKDDGDEDDDEEDPRDRSLHCRHGGANILAMCCVRR